jgi:hypothetical protein
LGALIGNPGFSPEPETAELGYLDAPKGLELSS